MRIAKDTASDQIVSDALQIIPRVPNVSLSTPIKGAIAYNLSDDPTGSVWFSNGTTWSAFNTGSGSGNEINGFPITNPPSPSPLPDGGIAIFNTNTSSWTVLPMTGDVIMDHDGVTTVVGLRGTPIGPFSGLTGGQVISWDGSKWTNLGSGMNGFPITNPPYPAPLPDASIPIFNAGTSSWTIVPLSGSVSMNNAGLTFVPSSPSVPVGTLLDFAGTTAPAGYLLCDGSSLSTSGTYSALFTVIQYTYGGSGLNFNIPDFRGRFARYADDMGTGAAGRDPGPRDGTLAQGQSTAVNGLGMIAAGNHNHIYSKYIAQTPAPVSNGNSLNTGNYNLAFQDNPTSDAGAHSHTLTQPLDAETRPINVQCYKIIKY